METILDEGKRTIKILCVSDNIVQHLYSPSVNRYRNKVNLTIGCGDLPYYYLEFLQSMLDTPLYYVHGNHDSKKEYLGDGTAIEGPMGGINLHCDSYKEGDLIIAGLEGSIKYNRAAKFQYTQTQMWFNVFYLMPYLLINKLRYGRYVDIFVAHSPPFGIHNGEDHVHVGFNAFLWFMKVFKPRYLIHGHRHVYNNDEVVETKYMDTTVLNIYPYKILEVELTS
ncbi:metallophosphoesterase [Anaerolineales bacterium HSG25]|nr:metallophosphoesterase [Anaerolineales bacterium HSG25]